MNGKQYVKFNSVSLRTHELADVGSLGGKKKLKVNALFNDNKVMCCRFHSEIICNVDGE